MDDVKRYTIIYTADAKEDIISKAEYIESAFRDSNLAFKWYVRLRNEIERDLSFMPYKYQTYDVAPWQELGFREFIFRNDIVLYSIDEAKYAVVIHAIFTKGKDISMDISDF